jgi:hypothetical protein
MGGLSEAMAAARLAATVKKREQVCVNVVCVCVCARACVCVCVCVRV